MILGFFMEVTLPAFVEFIAQSAMALVIWLVCGAIAASIVNDITKNFGNPGGRVNAVTAFFWLTFVASVASAVISFMEHRNSGLGGGLKRTEDDEI